MILPVPRTRHVNSPHRLTRQRRAIVPIQWTMTTTAIPIAMTVPAPLILYARRAHPLPRNPILSLTVQTVSITTTTDIQTVTTHLARLILHV